MPKIRRARHAKRAHYRHEHRDILRATAIHVFASMRDPTAKGAAALTDAATAEQLPLEILQLDVDDPLAAERAVRDIKQQTGQEE